jgi:hypothetical protein
MKKAVLIGLFAAVVCLSACNDDDASHSSSPPSSTSVSTSASPTPTKPSSSPSPSAAPAEVTPIQVDLSYSFEGKTVTKKADLFGSKMGYQMAVPPDFDASGDGKKDTFRLNGKDDISLTVERLPEGTDQQPVADQAEKDLMAKYKDVKLDTSLRNNKFFQNAIIWQGADTASATSVIVFFVNGHPFKATIYSNKSNEAALLELQAMVQTIKVPEK